MKYVIKVPTSNGEPCYIADWEGDPGRTLLLTNAKRFNSKEEAQAEIKKLLEELPMRKLDYSIKEIHDLSNMI